ncbi:LEA type 2 family protein [Tamlana sp. 2_MG-2023]|uniref:LEA type 2 family protein n=1 Tax=unclassified Tamlana TaxID=2614803 RepID=UPI0026E4813A|nr:MULTISPECIES: LEA type 2 family protein [unclassified Tamlana]MDO6759093.1 LEA type 2 family protein [Tamlana sp. 2_MG-2023]MDO6789792.1 LEA type 2 family protein [Tamlana sp. 1_MG-2023]
MKKLIILSTIFLTLLSCAVREQPEFLGVENIKISERTSQYITLNADALFKNPNDIGGKLITKGLDIYVNDNNVATVNAATFKVPAKKEFAIPLTSTIPVDSLLSDRNLTSLLGSFLNKSIKVQYKGDIKYKVFGFSKTYNIDKTENIKIKL